MLLTCEVTREIKCQREGIQILDYYHYRNTKKKGKQSDDDSLTSAAGGNDNDKTLSLEEELKQLQSKQNKDDDSPSAFSVYDTGCRGSVFVLCSLPNCEIIEPIQTEYQKSKLMVAAGAGELEQQQSTTDENVTTKEALGEDADATETTSKKFKTDDEMSPAATTKSETPEPSTTNLPPLSDPPVWDPIATVDQILEDRLSNTITEAPLSRFVTRMIPIQATCFAAEEELRLTCQQLLPRYFPSTTQTFAIVMKRRSCERLQRDAIIDTIATIVLQIAPHCKAQMEQPDLTIMVEICRSLCGISVLKNYHRYKNFNLFTLEEEAKQESTIKRATAS